MEIKNKKGQIAIFIIIGIVILAGVILFFVFRNSLTKPLQYKTLDQSVTASIEKCIEKPLNEGIKLISHQGGYIKNPFNRTFKFSDEDKAYDISFLCYTRKYYESCIVQEPLLLSHVESELEGYIGKDVKKCFDKAIAELDKSGYSPVADYRGFKISGSENILEINIDADVKTTYGDKVEIQKVSSIRIPSKLYNVAFIAQQIVLQESKFCGFDPVAYMMIHPQYHIDYFKTSDSIKIYTIQDKTGGDWFRFAVRSCVLQQSI